MRSINVGDIFERDKASVGRGGTSWKNNSSIAADGHGISPLKVEAEMTAVAVPSDERREGPAVAVEFAARAHPWRRRAMPPMKISTG